MYDLRTGEVIEHRGKPLARPPGDPTPCESCPRGSPEKEGETTLTEANWRAYRFYLEGRSMNWCFLGEKQKVDLLTRRIVSTIDVIVKNHDQVQLATMVAHRGLA